MFIVVTVFCVWLAVQVNEHTDGATRWRPLSCIMVWSRPISVGPEWLAKWLGPEYTTRVTTVDFAMNGGSRIAKQISYVTDADLIHLARLPDIRVLELGNNPALTDDGLFHLRACPILPRFTAIAQGQGTRLAHLSGFARNSLDCNSATTDHRQRPRPCREHDAIEVLSLDDTKIRTSDLTTCSS